MTLSSYRMHRIYLAATMGYGLGSDDPEELTFYNKIKDKNKKNKKFIFNNIDHYHELNAMNKNNIAWDNIYNKWLNSLI